MQYLYDFEKWEYIKPSYCIDLKINNLHFFMLDKMVLWNSSVLLEYENPQSLFSTLCKNYLGFCIQKIGKFYCIFFICIRKFKAFSNAYFLRKIAYFWEKKCMHLGKILDWKSLNFLIHIKNYNRTQLIWDS